MDLKDEEQAFHAVEGIIKTINYSQEVETKGFNYRPPSAPKREFFSTDVNEIPPADYNPYLADKSFIKSLKYV